MSVDQKVIVFPDRKSVQGQARDWLAKLDGDKPDAETIAAFRLWVNEDEAHRDEFERISAVWDDLNLLTQITTPSESKDNHLRRSFMLPFFSKGGGLIACAALVLLFFFGGGFIAPQDSVRSTVYRTAIGEQQTIVLTDQSTVKLNTNSSIKVDYNDKRRGIYLMQGEAHFSVAHNPDLPFEVYVGARLVRAIGTAFNIHLKHSKVEVIVDEGVVEIAQLAMPVPKRSAFPPDHQPSNNSVNSNHQSKAITPKPATLGAGSRATFERNKPKTVVVDHGVAIDKKLAWRDGMLMFRRETLQTLVDEVSRYTSTKIIVTDLKAQKMLVGGLFKVGDTGAVLDALESSYGINVSRIDNNVVYLSSRKK
jgi:transmembrane sensor